ncbi:replication origin-binding protein [Faustovirus]|nr:replication origin-binding protein [Faustovirus]SMH63358.1 Putative replication origin binding protein [Faustovirus]
MADQIDLPKGAEQYERYNKTPGFNTVLERYDHAIINDSKIVLYNAGRTKQKYIVCDRREFVEWYCNKLRTEPKWIPYFHEVCPDVNRKFIIDVDAKVHPDPDTIAKIRTEIMDCMITAFYLLYEIILSPAEIQIFCSHGVTKVSFHFVIRGYSANNLTTYEFQRNVKNMTDPDIATFVDSGIYKRVQNIRLCGSMKSIEDAEMRRKRPDGSVNAESITPEVVLESLIAHAPGARVIEDPTIRKDTGDENAAASLPDNNCEITNIAIKAASIWPEMANHKLRQRRGNRIVFDRKKKHSSACFACKELNSKGELVPRVHDNDNTLALEIMITGKGDSDYPAVVHAKCMKDKNRTCLHVAECSIPAEFINPDLVVNYRDIILRKTIADLKQNGWRRHLPVNPWVGIAREQVHEYAEPAMRKYELTPTLCVVAPMKTGKTKALQEYIIENYDDAAKIVICSFRQTFANEIKGKFPDFALYSQVRGEIDENRLIIQVESLHRMMMTPGMQPPDLMVLDECESIFEQFDSGLLRQFNESFAIFTWMLKYSKRVVLMDANLGQRTHNILIKMRPEYPPFYHVNSRLGMADDRYYFTSDKTTWYSALYASVLRGERSAIAVNSLQEAKVLYYDLSNEYPAIKFKLYSSETSHAERKLHFAQVNEYWSQYDVVIYTPTVSAGVSFEREHFHNIFGYFIDQSCNVETCSQMIGRVRNVKCNNFIIYLSGIRRSLPTNKLEINAQMMRNRKELYADLNAGELPLKVEYNADATIKFYTTEYYDVWVENVIMRNYSKNQFIARYIALTMRNGASIEYIDDAIRDRLCVGLDKPALDIANRCAEIKSKLVAEHASNVSAAGEIDDDAAIAIREKVKSQIDVTKDESNALIKYNLRKHYNWHNDMTSEFVIEYDARPVREVYVNLRRITRSALEYNRMNPPLPQLRAALTQIQQEEKIRFDEVMNNDSKYQNTDIARRYVFNHHRLAVGLLSIFRIERLWDESVISCGVVFGRIRENEVNLISALNDHSGEFGYRNVKIEDVKTKYGDQEAYIKYILKPINIILMRMYDSKIMLRSKIGMCEVVWTDKFAPTADKCAGIKPWIE